MRRASRNGRGSGATARCRSRGTRRNCAPARARAGSPRIVQVRKHDRDGKRPLAGAKQRIVQVGIERREFLVGRLLGQIGVRPKPFERPEFWLFHGPNCIAEWHHAWNTRIERERSLADSCSADRRHGARRRRRDARQLPGPRGRPGGAGAVRVAGRAAVGAQRRVRHRQPDFERTVVPARRAGARTGRPHRRRLHRRRPRSELLLHRPHPPRRSVHRRHPARQPAAAPAVQGDLRDSRRTASNT